MAQPRSKSSKCYFCKVVHKVSPSCCLPTSSTDVFPSLQPCIRSTAKDSNVACDRCLALNVQCLFSPPWARVGFNCSSSFRSLPLTRQISRTPSCATTTYNKRTCSLKTGQTRVLMFRHSPMLRPQHRVIIIRSRPHTTPIPKP